MGVSQIETLLQPFELFGIKLGLESSHTLLAALGNPHDRVPIVHVAGSNGKGSVCAYLSAVLTAAGYRVGRYTSPHLVDWTERICLNDQPIPAAELESVLQQVIAAIDPTAPPTQFEVITAAAWLYFAQQQVDIAVMEVGLGGRLDATNVVDRPLVTVITSLSLEHCQQLGPTLSHIATEKAGILKPGCPAVLGPVPLEAQAVLDRRLHELGCPAVSPTPAIDLGNGFAEIPLPVFNSDRLDHPAPISRLQYPLPLAGAIQLQNSALAIAALHWLRQQGWIISDAAIQQGMANTRWPGRLQWLTWHDRPLLIDGAHNPDSAKVLRQFVDRELQRTACITVCWVMGILATKDYLEMFRILLRPSDRLFLVPVPDHDSTDLQVLSASAQTVCPELAHCKTYQDVQHGLNATVEMSEGDSRSFTVLCGSLYLIGHFFAQEQLQR